MYATPGAPARGAGVVVGGGGVCAQAQPVNVNKITFEIRITNCADSIATIVRLLRHNYLLYAWLVPKQIKFPSFRKEDKNRCRKPALTVHLR